MLPVCLLEATLIIIAIIIFISVFVKVKMGGPEYFSVTDTLTSIFYVL